METSDSDPPLNADVTIVNGQAWALRPDHIAGLLRGARPGAVIADPAGALADPNRLAGVTDPQFWSGQPAALAEGLATSPFGPPPIALLPSSHQVGGRPAQRRRRHPDVSL
ncbi:MAG: hypothetical protein M0014_10440 [Actinomycetota bacterium]|nr:hypothetical protein [Actinomycetota bacterium]